MRKITWMMLLVLLAQGAWADDIAISSASDWQAFAERVNAGETTLAAYLTQDVDLGDVQAMVGTSGNQFRGRFDGKGHTLTVHYNASADYCAPFRYIDVAKIMNLHVDGTINTSAKFAAGIAGNVIGVGNTVMNCRVSTVITSSLNGDGTHGGLFAVVESNVRMTVSECLFDGKLLTTNGTTNCSGFAGFSRSWYLYFVNCLFQPQPAGEGETAVSNGCCTFARKADQSSFYTINCFYTTPLGTAQGNDGSSLDAATLASRLGNQWTVSDGKALPLMNRRMISGRGTVDEPYIIASEDDWNVFCAQVNSGQKFLGERLNLTADITVSEMAGTPDSRFSGDFYGNGHTLTFNRTATASVCAPFRYVSGVSIFGLHVAGTIETNYSYAAGIVGNTSADDNAIFNCRSSIVIHSSVNGTGSHGGMVGEASTDISLTDCLFDGSIQSTGGTRDCGGFVGYSYYGSRIPIRNCLYAPSAAGVTSGSTLVRTSYNDNLGVFNCYYTQTLGSEQGTDASALSANELAHRLSAMWEVVDGKPVPIMSQRSLSGDGSQGNPYIIASATDWHHFSTNVSNGQFYTGKHFKMTQDIDLGDLQAMVGCVEKRFLKSSIFSYFSFEGNFDGDGHTLTVAYKSDDVYCAPFRFISGSTVKNFRTAGTIETSQQYGAGIVAQGTYSTKDTNLENCVSGIVLTSSVSGEGCHGGLVASMGTSTQLNVRGCVFNGKLLTTNGTTGCGGIVGKYTWACTMENSAFAPQDPADGETPITDGNTLVRPGNENNLSITNCYYGMVMTTIQGSPVGRSISGAEGISVNILTEPQVTICDVPFYTSGTQVELAYSGTEPFNHYVTSVGTIGNAFSATGSHTLNEILGDVVISMSNEAVEREIYIAYDDKVATYYYDNQRSKHRFTGNPTDGESMPRKPEGAQNPHKVVVDASMKDARPTVETVAMFAFSYLESIEGLENLNLSAATSLKAMFYQNEIVNLDLSMLDTHTITDMSMMFEYCRDLKSITFGGLFTTENVTDMSAMFFDCEVIEGIDVSTFNTEKVTNMNAMFGCCNALKRLDLSNFSTPNLTKTSHMFRDCYSLNTICVDQTKWTVQNVTESEGMFEGCTAIVGCKGTTFNYNIQSKSGAIVDNGTRGYLWDVTDLPFGIYVAVIDQTMSFCNDRWRNAISITYDLPSTRVLSPWYYDCTEVKTVTFMPEFSTVRPVSTYNWFDNLLSLETVNGIENLNTSEVRDMSMMFAGCTHLKTLDVTHFDTHQVRDMSFMFSGCTQLSTLDVSGFNTDLVRNMENMFNKCSSLSVLDVSGFNTANVTNMKYMFNGCSSLSALDVSGFITAKVDTLDFMFNGCSGLTELDVSNFNTSKSTRMQNMFNGCSGLTHLDVSGFDTSHVHWIDNMFEGCSGLTELDVTHLDVSNVVRLEKLFKGCSSLTDIDVSTFNTENVQSFSSMFEGCTGLTVLDLSNFKTGNSRYFNKMFKDCTNLKTILVETDFDLTSQDLRFGSTDMFLNCISIVGGQGTTYQGNTFETSTYACIDGGASNPGYFTSISDIGYAVFDAATATMTFYGDTNEDQHTEGTVYALTDDWYYDLHFDVQKIVFHPSFAKVKPKTMYEWFTDFFALSAVEGWENLNTSRVTNMRDLFAGCHNMTTFDLSHFDFSKVTDRKNMLYDVQSDILLYLPAGMNASDFEGEDNGGLVHEDYNLVLDLDGDGQYICDDLRLLDIKDYNLQGYIDSRPIDYQIVKPFHAATALYQRTFTAGQRDAVYLPFAFSATAFGSLWAFDGEMLNNGKGIRLVPEENATTTPNTPYILDANGTAITATDVDVLPWTATEPTGADEMIGTVRRDNMPVGVYCYDSTKDNLRRVTRSNDKLSAGRAYFMLPNAAAGASRLTVRFGDQVPTDIDTAQQTEADGNWYTVGGQRLTSHPSKKGLYIHNGKVKVNK